MFKLILADGTEIKNLTRNGDNFISDTKVDESLFAGNLTTLTITDGEDVTIEMNNAELIQQIEYKGKYRLCFRELSERALKDLALESQLQSLAIMTDVDIDL